MAHSRHWFYWAGIVFEYWLCSLWLLLKVSPISIDNFGATTTFYWGAWGNAPPTPSLPEFDGSFAVRLRFLYPYWIAALILTILGAALTPWLLRICRVKSKVAGLSSLIAFICLLLTGVISDLGMTFHIWSGPVIYKDFRHLTPFLKIVVPSSLCAGVLVLVRDRLFGRMPSS